MPVGTTGESPTLSHDEHKRVVELAVQAAHGRVPVMAGAGSNSTAEAIGLAAHAENAGADAVLVVTPYYNKPTQEGLYRHYMAIAEAVDIPIYIYNIPGRSVIDMSVETMARLARHKNIVGVKDATANLDPPATHRAGLRPGVHAALGRGSYRARFSGIRRCWLHFRHRQYRAKTLRPDAGCLGAGRHCRRDGDPGAAAALA